MFIYCILLRQYYINGFYNNKNTPGNYCLDQRQNTGIESWQLYRNGANGYAYDTRFSWKRIHPGQLPWDTLSHNPADIESFCGALIRLI